MKTIINLVLATLFVTSAIASTTSDQVTQLPGLKQKLQTPQYAGYAHGIFYWYVAAAKNSNKRPIIIWTSGGPGTSSLYGFFNENGPYIVDRHGKVSLRHSAWSQFANYLVFDQPTGIGLSFTKQKDYPKTPQQGNQQYYQALQSFFDKHPNLRKHDIYLAGESYGATYMALLAQKIMINKNPQQNIKLKGLIVVSGWVAPNLQYSEVANYAYYHGLITAHQKQQLQQQYQACNNCYQQTKHSPAICYAQCTKIQDKLNQFTGFSDVHDIGKPLPGQNASDWQHSPYVSYLNNKKVRRAIHADINNKPYQPMTDIWSAYGATTENSVLPIYQELLKDNIRLLVFSGLDDASPSGFIGTRAWLNILLAAPQYNSFWTKTPLYWKNKQNQLLGYVQQTSSKNVTWVKVLYAGHVVPVAQPQIAHWVDRFVSQ